LCFTGYHCFNELIRPKFAEARLMLAITKENDMET